MNSYRNRDVPIKTAQSVVTDTQLILIKYK